MHDIPLLRIGLGLTALIALIALAVNLGEGGGRPASSTAEARVSATGDVPAESAGPDVAEHWREMAPILALLDSATTIRDPERRRDALKAVEDRLERAQERAPGAGEAEGSPRREYRKALEALEEAVDRAGGKKGTEADLAAVAEAREHLVRAATQAR